MFLFSFDIILKRRNTKAGFSLIELMVTIAIVTLVTGIVMVKYSSFNSVVILKSQAYELALDLRSAQVYGVGVGGTAVTFRGAYGIYFDLSSGSKNEYRLFQDQDDDRMYDEGEQIGEVYTIDPRFEISRICTPNDTECAAEQASVAFQRPDFDANIHTDIEPAGDSQIDVVITSIDNPAFSRVVTVYSSGQISVGLAVPVPTPAPAPAEPQCNDGEDNNTNGRIDVVDFSKTEWLPASFPLIPVFHNKYGGTPEFFPFSCSDENDNSED